MQQSILIVGVVSDDPFAIDVAHHFGQQADVADLIALKHFANTEFCPRFISDERDVDTIGQLLAGKTVVIVSTYCNTHTRNALAMRTCLVARAAKDNGAEHVVLVEPDLFFSAQDRGPQPHHGRVAFERDTIDYKKFDGQPFSSLLYAQLLKTAGVDTVLTVHNHSVSVQRLFHDELTGAFHNLSPAPLYANYLLKQDTTVPVGSNSGMVLCAPDKGAVPFVNDVFGEMEKATRNLLIRPSISKLYMHKERSGERHVSVQAAVGSPTRLQDLHGKDVIVFDDMVRTGHTIVECCKVLKDAGANRVMFVVTHFYSSDEVKENLNHPAIDEIITTNTLPSILNRDMQGRLRKKMLVLKIEKWIARYLQRALCALPGSAREPAYNIDVSSKNPRWKVLNQQQ